MNKTKIKCPRCHNDKLYKFRFDKQANQKYQHSMNTFSKTYYTSYTKFIFSK